LGRYTKESRESDRQTATKLGVNRMTLTAWLGGRDRPQTVYAGAVPVPTMHTRFFFLLLPVNGMDAGMPCHKHRQQVDTCVAATCNCMWLGAISISVTGAGAVSLHASLAKRVYRPTKE